MWWVGPNGWALNALDPVRWGGGGRLARLCGLWGPLRLEGAGPLGGIL